MITLHFGLIPMNKDYCHVSAQIAKHCDEPEEVECQECFSLMTESDNGNFLICDNVNCDNEIELNLGINENE